MALLGNARLLMHCVCEVCSSFRIEQYSSVLNLVHGRFRLTLWNTYFIVNKKLIEL